MAERQNQQRSDREQEGRQGSRSQTALTRRQSYDPFLMPFGGELFSPFSMMRRMMDEFDRSWSGMTSRTAGAGMWSPAIEVTQDKGKITVCAELPGLKKDDVHVEATDDELIIEGERKEESGSEEGGVRRTERRYGRFYRTIPLPEGASAEQAKARFDNGLLEITIPVQEERSSRRRIPLEAGEQGNK